MPDICLPQEEELQAVREEIAAYVTQLEAGKQVLIVFVTVVMALTEWVPGLCLLLYSYSYSYS